MTDADATWAALLVVSMALMVVGLLVLESAAWYVQYPVLVAALALSVIALLRAMAASESETGA